MDGANFQAANKPTLPHDMLYDPNSIEWEPDPDLLRDLFLEREADLEIERQSAPSPQLPPRQNNGGDPHPMLTAALGLAKQHGWKSFPARMEDGKKYSWLSKEHAPGGENWGMTNDPKQLQRNFTNPKWRLKCGVGVPTGWVNRIFDIEADTKEGHGVDGLASLRGLEAKHGKLPDTLMAESPTGSLHRIYKHPGEGIKVISRSLPGYPGVDIKGDGGMFVAPPSVRSDGEYRWLNDLPIADAPQWLIDLVTPRSNGKGADAKEPPQTKTAEAFKGLDPSRGLGQGVEPPPLLPLEPILAECGWLRHVHDTSGIDQSEVLWRDMLRVFMFLEQGESRIHEFSKEYPGYTREETEAKFERARKDKETLDLGYPKCQTICDHGSTHCKTCPHLAAEGSPLHLARQQDPLPAEPSFVDPYAEFFGPPFPLDALPPTLAKFVGAEHRNMGVDPSALAMAALTVVAGATHAETLVLAGEGWWERPILWGFLLGGSATMKTSVIKKTTPPLARIDHEQRKLRQAAYATWKQAQQGEQKGKTPPPPRPPRCILMDITPEKVAAILARSPCGALLVRDELASWIGNFERYNSDSRGFYLESWNGGESVKDRVGRGERDEEAEIHIENLALCILGGIQPNRLDALGDLTSDGLLQRGLPCLMRAAERGDQYYPVEEAEAAYDKLIKLIHSTPSEKYLFDQDALEVRDRVIDDIFKLEQAEGFSSALIAAIGKLKGYFARICLVLEVAKRHDPATVPDKLKIASAFKRLDPNRGLGGSLGTSKAISRETAEAAEKIVRQFLLPHIFGLYDTVVNGGRDRDMLRAIGDFILTSTKDRLRPSDFTAGVHALRGQPEQKIREWVGRFCAMDWLQPEATRPGVPPKAWLVVPGLREHFAERRRQAEAARAQAHAILKARFKGGPRGADQKV